MIFPAYENRCEENGNYPMNVLVKIAWRNVWRGRRRTLLIAVAMGVIMALLLFYDGVLAGFEQAVYSNAIEVMGGNIQVHAPGYNADTNQYPMLPLDAPEAVVGTAEALPGVVLATGRLNTGGMVTNREGAFGVKIVGVETEKEARYNPVARNIVAGRYLSPDDGDLIVIGQGLATAMGVGIGDRLTMVGNDRHHQTRQRTVTVAGVFDLGVPSIEKDTVYISLGEAQSLFDLPGQVTEVAVILDQVGAEPGVVGALRARLPGYEVDTWMTSYPEIKRALDMDKYVMAIFGLIMLSIAAIGIFNLLMMAVYERTREIGVVGTLGLKPRQISILFLLEGILIGAMGAVLGAMLGTLVNSLVGWYGIDYSQFTDMGDYMALFSGRIYTKLVPLKVLQHALTLAAIAAVAAIFPASLASRKEPAEALHYV
jgi:ABC-type lipoprotein release transport system permease subunit